MLKNDQLNDFAKEFAEINPDPDNPVGSFLIRMPSLDAKRKNSDLTIYVDDHEITMFFYFCSFIYIDSEYSGLFLLSGG